MDDPVADMLAGVEREARERADWTQVLALSIMRVLESEHPGFRAKVEARVRVSADRAAEAGEEARAADIRALADSWVFSDTGDDPPDAEPQPSA